MVGVVSSRVLGLLNASAEAMRRSQRDLVEAGERVAGGDDSTEGTVDLLEAEHTFQANAAVARTARRMVGTLLDTVA